MFALTCKVNFVLVNYSQRSLEDSGRNPDADWLDYIRNLFF